MVGAAFMVFCMVMMVRMMGMGHSDHGGESGHAGPRWGDGPERTLADRLAKGEIDVEEYERLLEAMRRGDKSPADGAKRSQSRPTSVRDCLRGVEVCDGDGH